MPPSATEKFDPSRAAEYAAQSRIALAGYEACHELAACLLSAMLEPGSPATVLVAGAGGTGNEILSMARLEPHWRFVAVDPSPPMLALAMEHIAAAALDGRTEVVPGHVAGLPVARAFDAATLIGVLHHVPGPEAQLALLRDIACRLRPGAPLVVAGNCMAYASEPLLMAAWGRRWRMHGASDEEVRAKLGKILHGADPPGSEQALADLLDAAGFAPPKRFFSSLFWSAWATRLR